MIKQGVVFDKVDRVIVGDYRNITLIGKGYRNEQTHTEVRLVLQEINMKDLDLNQYHQYFTE